MPDWVLGSLAAGLTLVVAATVGVLHRRYDGRVREVDPHPGPGSADSPAGAPAGGTAGAPAGGTADPSPGSGRTAMPLDLWRTLGVQHGVPVTLLQFSSAFCAPCRATRRICEEVAAMVDGVRHVEVDAEQHLDAVRRLGVRRTPTVLLIDAEGRVVRRAVGQPTKAHLIAALAPLVQG